MTKCQNEITKHRQLKYYKDWLLYSQYAQLVLKSISFKNEEENLYCLMPPVITDPDRLTEYSCHSLI